MVAADVGKYRTDLTSPQVAVRAQAAENLCRAGADAVVAASDLVRACSDEEAVRDWAVAALEDLGPPPSEQLPALTELLTSSNSTVAYWAATLLGRLGPAAKAAESALTSVLTQSTDTSVRERAAWALGKIGVTSATAVSALKEASQVGNPRLARLAQAALPSSQP